MSATSTQEFDRDKALELVREVSAGSFRYVPEKERPKLRPWRENFEFLAVPPERKCDYRLSGRICGRRIKRRALLCSRCRRRLARSSYKQARAEYGQVRPSAALKSNPSDQERGEYMDRWSYDLDPYGYALETLGESEITRADTLERVAKVTPHPKMLALLVKHPNMPADCLTGMFFLGDKELQRSIARESVISDGLLEHMKQLRECRYMLALNPNVTSAQLRILADHCAMMLQHYYSDDDETALRSIAAHPNCDLETLTHIFTLDRKHNLFVADICLHETALNQSTASEVLSAMMAVKDWSTLRWLAAHPHLPDDDLLSLTVYHDKIVSDQARSEWQRRSQDETAPENKDAVMERFTDVALAW